MIVLLRSRFWVQRYLESCRDQGLPSSLGSVTRNQHVDFAAFVTGVAPERLFAFTPDGERLYSDIRYRHGDALLFGRESQGLPRSVLDHQAITHSVRIPIAPGGRSLNLANAAAIAVYEAWRQHDFAVEGELG